MTNNRKGLNGQHNKRSPSSCLGSCVRTRWITRERETAYPLPEQALMTCIVRILVAAYLSLLPALASAVATEGASSSIVFPVAATTSSFETVVFVQNINAFAIDVDVLYYEANGIAGSAPGLRACGFLSLPANNTTSFKLAAQCPSLAAGSHYGLLILRDRAAQKINVFYAYSR